MRHLITILTLLLSAVTAFGHGEDQPGPHGGYIQMPANFHTEVVPDRDGSFHIYLLDMNFKNPTIQNSSVQARVVTGKKSDQKTVSLTCQPMGKNHFHCVGAKPKQLKAGKLILKATRDGTVASMEATYPLPFKPFPTAQTKDTAMPATPAKAPDKNSVDHSHH